MNFDIATEQLSENTYAISLTGEVDLYTAPEFKQQLLEVIAHREMDAFDRAIDLRVTRVRKKIEIDPAHPDAIRTVRGIGYMFVPPKD